MAIDMYKAMVGWSEYKNGDTKHTATHKLLTNEEFDELNNEISKLKKALSKEKKAREAEVQEINAKAVAYKRNADEEAENVKNEALQKVRAAKEELAQQKKLNDNLLRISKERANAKRGLQPKKEHCGYRFNGKIMQVKAITNHERNGKPIYGDVWTATLESPYDGSMPFDVVEKAIFANLMGADGIFNKLNIKCFYDSNEKGRLWKGTYEGAYDDGEDINECIVFDYKFMMNPKSNLWEIQFTTTKQFDLIKELMK